MKNGSYHIYNVVGADEWAENVNDNAFTNGVAIQSLLYANKAAKVLGYSPNPQWIEIASNIAILSFPDGVTKEYDGYQGSKIKQADVNLLSYPLGIFTDIKQIEKNLYYYENRVGDGPAMSHSIFSILYSYLGNPEEAYNLFLKSFKPNKLPPFGVLAETRNGTNPYFATAAGGMLQSIIAGFGGLKITESGIQQIKTYLPSHWESMTIKGVGNDNKSYHVSAHKE